jgi:hypothetical protein
VHDTAQRIRKARKDQHKMITNTAGAKAHRLIAALGLPAIIMSAMRRPYGDDDDDDNKIGKGFDSMLAKKLGNAEALARELHSENFQYREKLREKTKALTEAVAKLPEGAVVLTVDQAKAWEAYQALGKPEDITKELETGKAATGKLTDHERGTAIEKAAKDLKFNGDVLKQLATMHKLELTTRSVKDGQGKDVTAHYFKNEAGQETEAAQYAKDNWASFMPSLSATTEGDQGNGGAGGNGGGGSNNLQWPNGGGSGGGTGGQGNSAGVLGLVDGILKDRSTGPVSPLLRDIGAVKPAEDAKK